jgi:hypothetical protein
VNLVSEFLKVDVILMVQLLPSFEMVTVGLRVAAAFLVTKPAPKNIKLN